MSKSQTRYLLISLFLLLFLSPVNGQKLVGLHKKEIMKIMHEKYPSFIIDGTAVNTKYSYLKFIDIYNQETLFCFLNTAEECYLSRLMSDYSNLKSRVSQLNKENYRVRKNEWKYKVGEQEVTVQLKKEEWYFTLESRMAK